MTYRASNPPKPPASKAAAQITSTGTRARPVSKLLTIDEVAEVFNASSRTVRRLIESGALPVHRSGASFAFQKQTLLFS
jgi:excisionase family DNA binding protein